MFEELLLAKSTHADSQILMGTVGWNGVDDHAFPGDLDNDGSTLIRVTLYQGRDITQPVDPARAQGREIVCLLASHLGVPKKDARCYVAMPAGMILMPGAGVIFAIVSNTGTDRKRNLRAGEAALTPAEGHALVLTKPDGSITLHTTDNNADNGNSVFLRITPRGFEFRSPYGSLLLDASGFHAITASGARIDMGAISVPGLPGAIADSFGSYAKVTAATVKLAGGTVYLGQASTYLPVVATPPLPTTGTAPPIVTLGLCPSFLGSPGVWAGIV